MKVLFVINSLGGGGAERSLAQMVPGFAERGIESTLACLTRRHSDHGDEGIELAVTYLEDGGWWSRLRQLRRIVEAERPDLVHTTLFDSDVLGRAATIGRNIPVVTSLVNTSYDETRLQDPRVQTWKLRVVQAVDGFTARHFTTHFHALTEAVKQSGVRALGIDGGDVSVIPRGRDSEWLGERTAARRHEVRRGLEIDDAVPLVINVARQEFQKGQETLLRAAAIMRESAPDVRTMIAGREGNVTERLQTVHAELGLNDHVRFLGHRSDVPDLVAAADIFAFPSVYEGMGGAVVEAMGLGLPVVASDIPVLAEVVVDGETGLLCEPGNPDALAAALERLAADPGFARALGDAGRKRFEERFRLDGVTSAMADLLKAAAKDN